jgi:histidinol dehydrogenase
MITLYGEQGARDVLRRLAARSEQGGDGVFDVVRDILCDVRARGDAALTAYARRFDDTDYALTPLVVDEGEIDRAYDRCDKASVDALRLAARRIEAYHLKQREQNYQTGSAGQALMQIVRPLRRVGIYAPGGTASYPSSVLMNAIPASVAGVKEIFLATPAKAGAVNPLTLVAAREAGVARVYRMGGAQAIAAFAFGTASVPKVDKITGPGNRYVAEAKRQVFGHVGIDAIAGPSEVVIIADESANPRFIAADMIAQAEHDEHAAAILLTTSKALAQAVQEQLKVQAQGVRRGDIICASLENYGAVVVLETLAECVDVANDIAPEHLECMTINDAALLPKIENAGGVFLGAYSPEALGDYVAGTNHVLPTNGTARFASPLGVYDFVKRMGVLAFDKQGLSELRGAVEALANAEGLYAHGASAAIRFEEDGL